MVLKNKDNQIAKEIRRRIGGFNIDTHYGGFWTIKYLEDQIQIEYEDMTNDIKGLNYVKHLNDTKRLSDIKHLNDTKQ